MLLTDIADVVDEHLDDDRLKGLLAFDATSASISGAFARPRSWASITVLAGSCLGRPRRPVPSRTPGWAPSPPTWRRRHARAGVEDSHRGGPPRGHDRARAGWPGSCSIAASASPRASSSRRSTRSPRWRALLPPDAIDIGLDRAVSHVRSRGDAAKLHLALDAVPSFVGVGTRGGAGPPRRRPLGRSRRACLQPGEVRRFLPEPVMEITLPSLTDRPSRRPAAPSCRPSSNMHPTICAAAGIPAAMPSSKRCSRPSNATRRACGPRSSARNCCSRPTSRRASACPAVIGTTANCRSTR